MKFVINVLISVILIVYLHSVKELNLLARMFSVGGL